VPGCWILAKASPPVPAINESKSEIGICTGVETVAPPGFVQSTSKFHTFI